MRTQQVFKSLALLCLFAIASFGAFAQKVIPIDTSNITTLRIDPLNSYGGTASEVFESADYIPLETTKESTFGSIDQLEVTDQYFIILDQNTNCILLFNKDGKYHCKISGGSINANRENLIHNFTVNGWKKEIVYYRDSRTGSKYIFYDFNGKKLREEPFDFKKDPQLWDYKFIGADQVLSSWTYDTDTTNAVSTRYLIDYVRNFKEKYAAAFPYQIAEYKYADGNRPAYPAFTCAGNDTSFFYTKPSEYNIYKVTPNAIQQSFRLILPLFNSFPKGYVTDRAYHEKRDKYIETNKGLVYKLGDCYLLGDNLIFKLYIWNSNNTNLIYNLKSGMLISYGDILTDEKTCFMPTVESQQRIRGFLACDGKVVYSQFSSVEMFRAREQNKDKKPAYNQVLQQYFNKGSDRANPVLLKIKFKDNL